MSAPSFQNPEVLEFVRRNRSAVVEAVAKRLHQIGIPPELIGVRGVPGVEDGAFVRYDRPQGGGNIRPDHPNVVSGRWRAGINVDEAVFDPALDFLVAERRVVSPEAALACRQMWAAAPVRARLDAVAAHEFEELLAGPTPALLSRFGYQWPHYAAIRAAPDTGLRIAGAARNLLRLQRRAVGLQ